MNREWIEIMKQTKRLKLNRWHLLSHYSIVLFLLLLPGFTIFSLFEIYVTHTYDGLRSAKELVWTSWPWVIPAVAFYFIQKKQLKFKEVKIDYSEQEFQEAVERTARESGWQMELNQNSIFRAYRPWDWSGSWGEMITIIKEQDRLLINSICDPNKWSSVVSFGWNKRNIHTFLKNLIAVKKGNVVEEKKLTPPREWTLKKVLIRIVVYPFCFLLIGLGISMIFNPENWKSQGAGIGAVTIAAIYLYIDLKMIIQNKSSNVR